ncbi:MAG: YqaJ viral recombinase family protein, partial [Shewanella sp.]|nr:YqaJ viral recombinase family protein [Shewanella sp.]
HELEPVARELYSMQTDNDSMICGFMTNHGCGFSPDSLIGIDGISEIKTKEPHLQASLLFNNEIPDEHIAQIQGGLWVSGREWCDFVSYCPGMPLFVKKMYRNEDFIAKIESRIIKFYLELDRRMNIIVNR